MGLESRTPAGFPEKPRDHGIIWDHGHGIRQQNSRRVPHPGMWNAGAILILTIPSSPPQQHNPGFGMGGPMHNDVPPPPNMRGRGRGGNIRGRGRGRGGFGGNHGGYMNAGETPCTPSSLPHPPGAEQLTSSPSTRCSDPRRDENRSFGAPDLVVFKLCVLVQVPGTEATVTEGIRPRRATVSAPLLNFWYPSVLLGAWSLSGVATRGDALVLEPSAQGSLF